MRAAIQRGLAKSLDVSLVAELLDAQAELKRNYFLGGFRLSGVEGGRFAEAAFRLLQQITTGKFTPLGTQLDTEKLIHSLGNQPVGAQPDAVRLHIPRALRLIYDIRNKRDIAHLADGIDPNLQDATLVAGVADWVLAEFIRLYHSVSADEAQRLVDTVVTRVAPVVQSFDGFLKVLKPTLGASEHALVLLYHSGDDGATYTELEAWVRPKMRANLRRTLNGLVEKKDFVHHDGARYLITRLGQLEVERRRLIDPSS
jgi:hypothetical protein